MALQALLREYQGHAQLDVLREGVRPLAQVQVEPEVSQRVDAGRYERSSRRNTYRDGDRECC